jgi:nucleotide-binding universal stress UspA family protein
VALSVSTHNPAPVVVIHPDHHIGGSGPVVVGVDNSPNSEPAVAFAFDAASVHEAELVAVHTFTDTVADGGTEEEHAMLSEQLAGWREKYPEVSVRHVVVHGRPAPILLEHTHDAQLIVVGSRGRHGLTSFVLGSTSRALIAHSECPVVVVRPEILG